MRWILYMAAVMFTLNLYAGLPLSGGSGGSIAGKGGIPFPVTNAVASSLKPPDDGIKVNKRRIF